MSSSYSRGDLPIVNVSHLIRTAKEKILLTVDDRGVYQHHSKDASILNLHKGIRIFKTESLSKPFKHICMGSGLSAAPFSA